MNQLQQEPTTLLCDNQSAIKLTENLILHARTKHIEVHHHFIQEKVQNKEIDLTYSPTADQVTHILTKSLGREKFQTLRERLGVKRIKH